MMKSDHTNRTKRNDVIKFRQIETTEP